MPVLVRVGLADVPETTLARLDSISNADRHLIYDNRKFGKESTPNLRQRHAILAEPRPRPENPTTAVPSLIGLAFTEVNGSAAVDETAVGKESTPNLRQRVRNAPLITPRLRPENNTTEVPSLIELAFTNIDGSSTTVDDIVLEQEWAPNPQLAELRQRHSWLSNPNEYRDPYGKYYDDRTTEIPSLIESIFGDGNPEKNLWDDFEEPSLRQRSAYNWLPAFDDDRTTWVPSLIESIVGYADPVELRQRNAFVVNPNISRWRDDPTTEIPSLIESIFGDADADKILWDEFEDPSLRQRTAFYEDSFAHFLFQGVDDEDYYFDALDAIDVDNDNIITFDEVAQLSTFADVRLGSVLDALSKDFANLDEDEKYNYAFTKEYVPKVKKSPDGSKDDVGLKSFVNILATVPFDDGADQPIDYVSLKSFVTLPFDDAGDLVYQFQQGDQGEQDEANAVGLKTFATSRLDPGWPGAAALQSFLKFDEDINDFIIFSDVTTGNPTTTLRFSETIDPNSIIFPDIQGNNSTSENRTAALQSFLIFII